MNDFIEGVMLNPILQKRGILSRQNKAMERGEGREKRGHSGEGMSKRTRAWRQEQEAGIECVGPVQ